MLTQNQKIQLHKDICDSLHKLYEEKNNDYGDSVADTYKRFGIEAFLVRMYDKLNRLYSLSRPDKICKIEDEKYTDTLADLANYAILAMIELENEKSDLVSVAKEYTDEEMREMIMSNPDICHNCGTPLNEHNKYMDGMCTECKYGIDDYPYTEGGELGYGKHNKENR